MLKVQNTSEIDLSPSRLPPIETLQQTYPVCIHAMKPKIHTGRILYYVHTHIPIIGLEAEEVLEEEDESIVILSPTLSVSSKLPL